MNQHSGSSAEKTVRIGNRPVGGSQPCYVIAEIGINHNGEIDLAKRGAERARRRAVQAGRRASRARRMAACISSSREFTPNSSW